MRPDLGTRDWPGGKPADGRPAGRRQTIGHARSGSWRRVLDGEFDSPPSPPTHDAWLGSRCDALGALRWLRPGLDAREPPPLDLRRRIPLILFDDLVGGARRES